MQGIAARIRTSHGSCHLVQVDNLAMRTPDDWLSFSSIGGFGNMLVDFALSPAVTLFGQTACRPPT
jgi:hypothetical protein